jgi:hypothetical protein
MRFPKHRDGSAFTMYYGGMNAALIVGIGDYPSPISKLPAVAADVREIGKILGSKSGSFSKQHVRVLTDQQADKTAVLEQLRQVFDQAGDDDTVFVYMAGHGAVFGDDYYFVARDTDPTHLPSTGVPLAEVKRMFDACQSNRLLLWLDFCHSGGIIPRQAAGVPASGSEAIQRILKVVGGQGRMIFAACTPEQSAYEDAKLGHGVFTAYLLEGLKGAAEHDGEVTTNSLFDFIDRKMGSNHQRPMLFGQMTGRVVLIQHDDRQARPPQGKDADSPATENAVVESTGNWCFVGKLLVEAASVRRLPDGNFVLEILSKDSETDAALAAISPVRHSASQPIPFAHRSDGMLVRIGSVESRSTGNDQVWTVVLKADQNSHRSVLNEVSYSTGSKVLSPDDQAKMRAGRLLLNDPPALKNGEQRGFQISDGLVESFIQGMGLPVSAKECVVQSVYKQMRKTDESFLRAVRLTAVFMLKATHVCEHILQLTVGPISAGRCHIRLRGKRVSVYQNKDPFEIELDGDCPLE